MAKFVLAGKADCPHYAKAELLADALQGCLPNFRVQKISILPDEWNLLLPDLYWVCDRNGWKHSPLVWRELVYQGGKGMLLGGFSDFLEHCQDYYGITSDMPTDMMLSIAAENLKAKMDLIMEEECHASLVQPLHIWITGALSPTCHILIPNLLSAEVFPQVSAISLHLLELQGNKEELQGLRMEVEDLALSMLHENGSDEEKKKTVKERYRKYGQLIDTRANKEVKVIVSGDSFVNLRCSLLVDSAHSVESQQFVATATQLENEARAIIAKKMKVRTSDITDVIVWGNISGVFYVDLQRAKVCNYNGAIKGPAFVPQPVLKIFHDRKWLETDFQRLVQCQRGAVASKTGRAADTSAANGILTVLRAWNGICDPDEVLSVGVLCPGHNNLPDDIVQSVPVKFTDGKWSVVSDVTVGDELKERLQLSASELRQVCEKTKTIKMNN
uniref:Malate dehydrogenase 1B n=1 Tax=Stegastes partitus TaxID=144197 RepID=A0A3B5B020_9TELE